jgi:hypothetical protein
MRTRIYWAIENFEGSSAIPYQVDKPPDSLQADSTSTDEVRRVFADRRSSSMDWE